MQSVLRAESEPVREGGHGYPYARSALVRESRRLPFHIRALRTIIAVVAVVGVLSSCFGTLRAQEPPGEHPGVPIVKNEAPSWLPGHGWRFSEQPILDIGVVEGDTNYQFYRISSVVRLQDGRIVVADGGNSRLKFFDASGRFLRSSGRKGGGPGEFATLSWVRQLDTDTLVTWDPRNQRLSVFTPDGDYVRSVRPQTSGSAALRVLGAWGDGDLLASMRVGDSGPLKESEIVRESFLYIRYASDGSILDTVGRFPGSEFYQVGSHEGSTISTMAVAVPFMRGPHVALSVGGFYFGTGDTYAIGAYGRDGTLTSILRCGQGNRRVTSDIAARYKEERLHNVGNANVRRTFERAWSTIPFPETMPAYQGLFADDGGNLWVRDYAVPGETDPPWQVFDAEGRWLGRVDGVPGFALSQVGADFALGVWKDDMGVEHVRLYRLVRA